jgi:hypothetical protein
VAKKAEKPAPRAEREWRNVLLGGVVLVIAGYLLWLTGSSNNSG